MPTRTTYRHGDLREALIEATIDMVNTEGASALSMREAARRVGVSNAAPYHHFEDKTALLVAVAARGMERLSGQLRAAIDPDAPAAQQLRECGTAYICFALDNTGLFRVMFRPEFNQTQAASGAELAPQVWDVLTGVVERCQLDGIGTAMPTRYATATYWAVIHGHAAMWIERPLEHAAEIRPATRADAPEVARRVIDVYASILGAR